MTIRTRITAAIVFAFAAVVGLSALAIVTARSTARLVRAPEEQVGIVENLDEARAAVASVFDTLDDFVDGHSGHDEVAAAMTAADTAIETIETAARDADDRELAVDLRAAYQQIAAGERTITAHVLAGDHEGAHHIMDKLDDDVHRGVVIGLLAQARATEHEDIDERVAESEGEATTIATIAGVIAAVGLLVMVIAAVILRRVQRRLSRLTAVVGGMAGGALDVRSADVAARDELGDLGRTFNAMADNLATMVETAADKEALTKELALADRMQQAMLPRAPALTGLELSATMLTASEVGGDYYDVIATADGGWIGIGDVSGHGFNAGVVMMMAQTAIAACVRARPDAGPAEILRTVNRVLYDNVRTRLGLRAHMTLSLLRYYHDGRIVHAGAHQELVTRDATGVMREVRTEGPWLAVVPELARHVIEREMWLGPGESLVLFTDGVTEARRRSGDEVGLDGLVAAIAAAPLDAGADALCRHVMAQVRGDVGRFDDDATLVVVQRPAPAFAAAAA